MEQVQYVGFSHCDARAAVALCCAFAFNENDHIDNISVASEDFLSFFIPTDPTIPLSGLRNVVCGSGSIETTEYLEPFAWTRLTEFGVIFGSERGDVEAAAAIVKHVLCGTEDAFIWWSPLNSAVEHDHQGTIRLTSSTSHAHNLNALVSEIAGSLPPSTSLQDLATDQKRMFDLLTHLR